MPQDTENRFEKHKGKVYFVLLLLFSLILLGGGYYGYLSLLKDVRRGLDRHIVLREVAPLSTRWYTSIDNGEQVVRRADENGFVKPAKIHEHPDFEVVFLGGSTTVCNVVHEESRFPYLSGRLLEKATGKRINAYNGGKSGNDSMHSVLSLLSKVVPMQPDAVVLMHAINDLNFLMIARSYWTPHPHRGIIQEEEYNPLKKWLIEKVLGHKFQPNLTTAFDQYKGKRADPDIERITTAYRKSLELFIFICRQHDITPVLMTQANRITEKPDDLMQKTGETIKKEYLIEYPELYRAYTAVNETTRQVANDHNVLLIDLAKGIESTPKNLYDSVHMTTQGNEQAARLIANKLQPLLQ